jgi:hypothetical protein
MNAVPHFRPAEGSQLPPDQQGRGLALERPLASGRKGLVVWGLVLATLLIAITIAATATVFAWPAVV